MEFRTPVEALRLAEDIAALRLAETLLLSVDNANITDTRKSGDHIMRVTISQIRFCRQYAEKKLRRFYLSK